MNEDETEYQASEWMILRKTGSCKTQRNAVRNPLDDQAGRESVKAFPDIRKKIFSFQAKKNQRQPEKLLRIKICQDNPGRNKEKFLRRKSK